MSLFRNENPILGPQTGLTELSGFGTGTPVSAVYKPTTREILSFQQGSATVPSAAQYVFVAPWQCQVLAMKTTFSTASSSGTLDLRKVIQSALPLAPSTAANGSTVFELLASTLSLSGTANTTGVASLTTASGSPLILQAGDQLALLFGGTLTGLVGSYTQIEIAQIG
jgi:hypothetical protein